MVIDDVLDWLAQGNRRKYVLVKFKQPSTAKQLARQTGMSIDSCSYALWELAVYELVKTQDLQLSLTE